MTEAEWQRHTDLPQMLKFISGKTSERKLRLFACACCRRLWNLLEDARCRDAVKVAERVAEGSASDRERTDAWNNALEVAYRDYDADEKEPRVDWAASAVLQALDRNVSTALGAAEQSVLALERISSRAWSDDEAMQVRGQAPLCPILRDIVGNPFSPVTVDPTWRKSKGGAVEQLFRAVYEERQMPAGTLDTSRLGILADALEDAGCSDDAILDHLRDPGFHVYGCWVLDLVLGKDLGNETTGLTVC